VLHCLPNLMTVSLTCLQEKDQNRVKGMRIMLERQTRAAAAAASVSGEAAAKAAAEAQLVPPSAPSATLVQPAPTTNSGAGPTTAFAGTHPCLLVCLHGLHSSAVAAS
jgi:hypothetical protein